MSIWIPSGLGGVSDDSVTSFLFLFIGSRNHWVLLNTLLLITTHLRTRSFLRVKLGVISHWGTRSFSCSAVMKGCSLRWPRTYIVLREQGFIRGVIDWLLLHLWEALIMLLIQSPNSTTSNQQTRVVWMMMHLNSCLACPIHVVTATS